MAGSDPRKRQQKAPHVCPWWLGPLLVSPLRRLIENPERVLAPYVRPGMTVLEPGCGMGYFTLPLARMVAPGGRVVAVDLQPRMIEGLLRRARKAGVSDRIVALAGALDDARLAPYHGAADLAVVLHVAHEVSDQEAFLARIHDLLRPGGELLLVEPRGHVSASAFSATLERAAQAGLVERGRPTGARGRAALLQRLA